jgi:type IV secretory pathway TraG/TraD family ATPase VirD4
VTNKNHLEQLRRCRQQSRSLKRKGLPADQSSAHEKLKKSKDPLWISLLVAALYGIGGGCLIAGCLASFHQHKMISLIIGALVGAPLGALVYGAWPTILWLCRLLTSRPPEPHFFRQFQIGHLPVSWLSFSALLTLMTAWLMSLFGELPALPVLPVIQRAADAHLNPFDKVVAWFFQLPALGVYRNWLSGMISELGWVCAAFLLLTLALFAYWQGSNRASRRAMGALGSHDDQDKNAFRLWLGDSTGRLAQLGHGTSLAPGQKVSLTLEDAAQNILILGGIGSGKTTRVVHPLLLQLLDQQCGGLIFDVKGDFHHAVRQFSQETGQPVITLGPGHTPLNLLAGLTPEMAASFLKSVLLLADPHPGSSFWIESATELCRNSLGLLSFIPHHYSLKGLYRYLFNTSFQAEIADVLETRRAHLTEDERGTLEAFEEYQRDLYDRLDEKVKAGMFATLAQVLSPFNQPALTKAFCTATPNAQGLTAVLTGSVFLVNLPLATWGLGAKVVYTLIKLRFYNLMQQRTHQAPSSALRPVFFLCDEFQEIVSANKDGLSDLNFWDKSRSSKTIGIVSAQAISSFYAALGNRDLADALCQNFRQKLCFRTEDLNTLQYFQTLADKVEVSRRTVGESSGTQEQGGRGSNSSRSKSESTSWTEKQVLNAQIFRQLSPDQAIALLSIGGQSADDILDMRPVYVAHSVGAETEALMSA